MASHKSAINNDICGLLDLITTMNHRGGFQDYAGLEVILIDIS